MYLRTKSYLTIPALIVCLFFCVGAVHGAEIFLSPDTTLLTGGVGTELDLELRVDAATQDLKLYVVTFRFDRTKIDTATNISGSDTTAAITEGPLLESAGTTVFNYYIEAGDSLLTVEGLVLGYQTAADGPGVLANIHVVIKDTGLIDLEIVSWDTRDLNNDPLPSDAVGALIFNDYPPLEFNLIDPPDGGTETLFIGDNLELVWEQTTSLYAENVSYELRYGTDPGFAPAQTTTVSGLSDTTYKISVNDLEETGYYWAVEAIGDVINVPKKSTPESQSLLVQYGANAPDAFDLQIPSDAVVIELTDSSSLTFEWDASSSGVPNIDSVWYVWAIGPAPVDVGTAYSYDSVLDITQITLDTMLLPMDSTEYEWSVWAYNTRGLSTPGSSTRTIRLWRVTTCCKFGFTGNISYDPEGTVDVSDLTRLVNFLFVTFEPLECEDEANTNGDPNGDIDVSDLTRLVNHLFVTVESLAPCP